MKKIISIICSITILIASVSFVVPVFAATGNSIDTVVEELSELYQEEAESGKKLEDSAQCRIIVKANRKPDTYGDAQFVKGTDKIYIYQYSDITSANSALEHYNSLSYVQWAETDGVIEGQSLSYGNDMMGSDEAKNYVVNNNISTAEVNIAVIDGGINFKLKDFINSGRVIDSGVNLSDSGTEGSAQQDHGNYHGSNITSIILDNTSDNVNIIGYKALNKKGLGADSSVAMCIMTAVDDNVDIINLSLGAKGHSDLIAEAVNYALENDIVVVASAGNYCDDTVDYYPANVENVITVGSVDYNGNRTFFSNYGEEVDFVAPGYNIEVWGNKSISSNNPDYASGTSFSAPFVTSAAAMALTVDKDLSINQVKSKLTDSCITQSEINYKSQYYRAVEISNENLNGFVQLGNPKSENLFYGYGMPQMQAIIGLTAKSNIVEFSVSSGIYNNEFELTLLTDNNADIYYTTDEKYPSKINGNLYTKPIKIDSTTCIRAIAYADGKIKGVPSAREYKIEYLADESDFKIDERGYITEYTGKGKNGNYIEIKVPDVINGTVVKGVAKNTFLDSSEEDEIEEFGEYDIHLKGISLPETVTEIESNSFENVYSLKYFSAPGLKIVGDFALDAPVIYLDAPNIEYIGKSGLVTNLSEINLPKLTYADDNAFCNNVYLTDVNMPLLTKGGAALFSSCKRLTNADLDQVKVLGDCSFSKCCWLKNVMLPKLEEILYFGNSLYIGMFNNCINLINIDLPELYKLNSKTNSSFYNCYNLKSINAPKLEVITDEMFSNCYKLEEVNIPNAKIIGKKAFYFTNSLNKVDFNFVTKINTMAFSNSSVKLINTPTLNYLGSYCFANYSEFDKTYDINNILKLFYAPKLNEIDDYALAYTGGLTELDLPNLTTIGENAFYESSVNSLYAPNLETAKSLPITENSTIILSSLFKNCTENTKGRNYNVYGITGSDAETWAKRNNHTFVGIPAIITDIPDVYNGENSLSVKAIGIDVCYKWYGCDNEDGIGSILLNTETDGNFNPLEYRYYPYYFCVCEMEDNGRKFSIQSAICKNADYRIADYSKVDELINKIPADLSLYTDESVAWLNNVLNNIQRDLPITEQNTVDGYADKLEQAISRLALKEFPTEPTNPTQPDDPSTEPSTKPTTIPKENTTKPCEGTTEKPSESQNRTSNSDINHNQSTKRNTDTKSPLTGNNSECIIISIAVISCITLLLVVTQRERKKSIRYE